MAEVTVDLSELMNGSKKADMPEWKGDHYSPSAGQLMLNSADLCPSRFKYCP